jgi:enamine deaminase RidA (YjgF/YER057c/UK114 family)
MPCSEPGHRALLAIRVSRGPGRRAWVGDIVKPTDNLERLGLALPTLIPPSGSYAHATRSGNLLFLSGKGVGAYTGKVGREVSLEQAREFARSTTLMLLAVIKEEIGSIDRVSRFLKITGFVNSAPDFSNHPGVMDACSEMLRDIFGEPGIHARTSIGVAATPGQIPLEIEAVVEFRE